MSYVYETDGATIYQRSFAIIRAEARLDGFEAGDEKVAVRIIHASGMVEVADDIVFTPGFSAAASAALRGARRSSAMPRWWPMALRGHGCPPTMP